MQHRAPLPAITTTGFVEVGTYSADRNLRKAGPQLAPRLDLQVRSRPAPGISLVADVDIATTDAHGGDSAAVFRSAYVHYATGALTMRAGIQSISWGRADVINPTDNLTPYRYTWLAADDADLRIGTPAIRLDYRMEQGTFTGILLPYFRPTIVPTGDPGPVVLEEKGTIRSPDFFAFKFSQEGGSVDWSLSFTHGPALRPNLVPSPQFASSLQVEEQHPTAKVAGADFAWPVGPVVLRGEAAFSKYDRCCVIDDVSFQRSDNAFGVLGLESGLGPDWRLLLQAFHKRNFDRVGDHDGPQSTLSAISLASDVINDERRTHYTGLTAGIFRASLASEFSATIETAYILQTKDESLRPRLSWSPVDTFTVTLGADLYRGTTSGPLGRLRDNSLGFLNLRYSFSGKFMPGH